jgi:superfamily II DNA or RNA helicase
MSPAVLDQLRLRGYQHAVLDKIEGEIYYDETQRFACVLPMGAGKTVIFSWLARFWTESWHKRIGYPGRRLPDTVCILVDRDELVDQTLDKLHQVAPHLTVGVVKAERNELDSHIIVASVQTLRIDRRLAQMPPVGLVIVDECDLAAAPGYVKVMERLGCWDPAGAKAIGFTATLSRKDGRLADVWEKVPEGCRYDILDMIRDGWLVDVSGRRVTVDGLTFDQVQTRGGDYAAGSLSDALTSADAMRVTADAYEEWARDRSGIVFTPNVESAYLFRDEFRERGFSSEVIHGAMPKDERKETMQRLRSGDIQIGVNCMVMTRGTDIPIASCAVIARPTLNPSLYVQMVGRVLRPYPGDIQGTTELARTPKNDALVLDLAGASEAHRLATLADLTSRRLTVIPEGQSLERTAAREAILQNPMLADYILDSYQVDLFGLSQARWLQTYEGIWFLMTQDELFFLWPDTEPDRYKVGRRPVRTKGGGWVQEGVDFYVAKEWAEQEATRVDNQNVADGGARLASRTASWRQGRNTATVGQLNHARRIGLKNIPEGISKAGISDMSDVHTASKLLDRALKKT